MTVFATISVLVSALSACEFIFMSWYVCTVSATSPRISFLLFLLDCFTYWAIFKCSVLMSCSAFTVPAFSKEINFLPLLLHCLTSWQILYVLICIHYSRILDRNKLSSFRTGMLDKLSNLQVLWIYVLMCFYCSSINGHAEQVLDHVVLCHVATVRVVDWSYW